MKCKHSEQGLVFYFQGQQRTPIAPWFSQPLVNSVSDTSAYLMGLTALTPPPVGQNPLSEAKQELLSPSMDSRWDHFYQSAVDW